MQGAAQQAVDARCHMQQLQEQMEQLAEVAREAEAGADAAAGGFVFWENESRGAMQQAHGCVCVCWSLQTLLFGGVRAVLTKTEHTHAQEALPAFA